MICQAIKPNSLRHGSLFPRFSLLPLLLSLLFACTHSEEEWKSLILRACVFRTEKPLNWDKRGKVVSALEERETNVARLK